MYCTRWASKACEAIHWRLPRTSSTHKNVSVRSGLGNSPALIAATSARAIP
jgi:hypothetical protein